MKQVKSIVIKAPKALQKVGDGAKHIKTGFSNTYNDTVYFVNLSKISNKSISQIRDHSRIQQDLMKIVPFSALMVIPFAEVLIPPYLKLFPNAIPTGFLSSEQQMEKKENIKIRQKAAHKKLHKQINKILIEQGVDIRKVDSEDKIEILLAKGADFEHDLDLNKADTETLMNAADFLGVNVITGTNIASTLFQGAKKVPTRCFNLIKRVFGK